MKLYLVRHGETQLNLDRVYYGWTDCPLNETGMKQGESLAEYFKTIQIDKIITSDLLRATTTAEMIKGNRNIPLEKRVAFRELHFGEWEEKDFHFVKTNYPEGYQAWAKDWKEFQIPKGESFRDFYERVSMGLKEILETENEDSNILLVSHNGVMSALLCYLIGVGEDGFWKFSFQQKAYSLISIKKSNVLVQKINSPID